MAPELYLSSFALSVFGAWLVARFAGKLFAIDCPNARSSHLRPTPKGGGVGILAAFSFVCIISGISSWFWGTMSTLALITGYGDRVEMSARTRLFAQLCLAGVFILGTWQPTSNIYLSPLLMLLWLIFIVGTANFYNFMDGIDGVAGMTGVVGFSLLAFYIYSHEGQVRLANLSLCMACSCLGFLPLNMPKAKVFMGDIGSILLGAVFSGLIYLASHRLLDFLCMASFLFPFYADELTTIAVRLKRNESLTQPHRRHIYQILANEKGIDHWKVSLGFGFIQFVVGVSAMLARPFGVPAVFALLVLSFIVFAGLSFHLRSSLERHTGHRLKSKSPA